MAKKGLEAVSAYKKKVQSRTEEFALQIIGMRSELRDKFILSSGESTHSLAEDSKVLDSPLHKLFRRINTIFRSI